MAELTKAQMEAKIASLEADNKRLGDEGAKQAAAIAKAAKKQPEIVPVSGTKTVSWEDVDGEAHKATVSFKDGQVNVRLNGGNIVKSEAFLKVCNGKDLSKDELAASPALKDLKKEDAIKWLTRLARLNATSLNIKDA